MNEVLNVSEQDMEIGCHEGLLGNFIADMNLTTTDKDDEKVKFMKLCHSTMK